jgi:trans-aconitate 2-methyltransferase
MMSAMWDAAQYKLFGDERSRPFFDLLAQVGADRPRYVTDLGCGPGNLTAALAERWPDAEVTGIDSSPEMIAAASAADYPGVTFRIGDVQHWQPERAPDVIVSNAVLQWVPGHENLLPRWASWLAEDGWLAFQVPANFDEPSHAVMRELAAAPRWAPLLGNLELTRQTGDPSRYAELLAAPGRQVNAWETTYVHILHGENAVTEWVKGTGLRPVLGALDKERAAAFLAEYSDRMRVAYPARPSGTLFPFRRVFAVVHRRS